MKTKRNVRTKSNLKELLDTAGSDAVALPSNDKFAELEKKAALLKQQPAAQQEESATTTKKPAGAVSMFGAGFNPADVLSARRKKNQE